MDQASAARILAMSLEPNSTESSRKRKMRLSQEWSGDEPSLGLLRTRLR